MKPRLYFFDRPTILLFIALGALSVVMVGMGRDFQGLDLQFYYSKAQALKILGALSLEQRQRYLLIESLDFVYIFIYTSLLFWNMRKVGGRLLIFFSLVPGLFDIGENICIMHWLRVPGEYFYLDILPFLTILKWSFGVVVTSLFFIKFFLRRVKEKDRSLPNQ